MQIPIDRVLPNPDQPRTIFDEEKLSSLAETIKSKGQIHPILVDKAPDGYYILIDGERRLRAMILLGKKTIRAEIREQVSDDRLELALISNIQKASMGPVDEARAYEKLVEKHKTIVAVSKVIGVSVHTITVRLSMLDFPEDVQKIFNMKALQISTDIVRMLKRLDSENMIRVATTAAARGWTAKATLLFIGKELKRLAKPASEKSKVKQVSKVKEIVIDEPVILEEKVVRAYTSNTYQLTGNHFNALAMVGDRHVLPMKLINISVDTCKACPLYREAGPAICGQCAMVDFLNRIAVSIKIGP